MDPLQAVKNIIDLITADYHVWVIKLLLAIASLCGKCAQIGTSDELATHPAMFPASRPSAAGIGSSILPPTPQGENKWLEDGRMDI